MFGIKYNCNACDQKDNELMIHFTSYCPNQCVYCIDKLNKGVGHIGKPNTVAIINTIKKYHEKADYITFSGGEPCVFLDELLEVVEFVKMNTKLQVSLITSVPDQCVIKKDTFFKIIDLVDNVAISVQHYNERWACRIRGHQDWINRQTFYQEIPNKDKFCINLNLIRPWLCDELTVCEAISHYNKMGYKNIRIAELFDRDDMYVSFEEVFNIKMGSPFATGCKTKFDISKWIPDFDGNLTVKRSCFMCTNKQHASLKDIVKICTRNIIPKKHFFGVVYEDGSIHPYWK